MEHKTLKDFKKSFGTSLQGYINCSYARLVEVFGEPTGVGDDYKSDAEWVVEFSNGTIATIYNYKTGKNYLGSHGQRTKDITDWHIGGEIIQVVELVEKAIK